MNVPTMSRARGVLAALAVAAVLAACSGCAINAGGAATSRASERFSGVADVDEVAVSGSNNLPFMGSANVVLRVDDAASPERAVELGHELGAFMAHDGGGAVSWKGAIEYERFTVEITDDRALNDTRLAIAGPMWESGVEGVLSASEVLMSAVDADGLEPAARRSQALAAHDSLEVRSTAEVGAFVPVEGEPADGYDQVLMQGRYGMPTRFEAVADPGVSLEAEFDVFDEVRASYPVEAGRIREGEVSLLVTVTDLDSATALAEQLAAASGIEVEIERAGPGDVPLWG